jgi:hypothetical protein
MSKRCVLLTFTVTVLLGSILSARAQYSGIPNYTGPNAGLAFRTDINKRFAGLTPIEPLLVSSSFANLPPEQDGMMLYCNDCARTNPCTGGGSGAFAFGYRGAWQCTAPGPLEQNLNANGFAINNLLPGVNTGDAISINQSGATLENLAPTNDTSAIHNIDKYSIGWEIDPEDPYFGAMGTTAGTPQTLSLTTTASNATATFGGGSSLDFAAGQHVVIKQAGPTSTLPTPSAPTVTGYTTYGTSNWGAYQSAGTYSGFAAPGCFPDKASAVPSWAASTNYNQYAVIQTTINSIVYGYYNSNASCTSGSSTPSFASTLTSSGTTTLGGAWVGGTRVTDNTCNWVNYGLIGHGVTSNCSTNTTYKIVYIDSHNGRSAPSPTVSITGPDVTSSANVNLLQWTPPSGNGIIATAICGCTGASCTPSSLWAIVPQMGADGAAQVWMDEGNHFGSSSDGTVCSASGATAQDLLTTISSISTSSVTLASAPSQSGTFPMYHDDEPALAAAVAAAESYTPPRAVHLPNKLFTLGQTWTIPAGTIGLYIRGDLGATLQWAGPLGGAMLYSNGIRDSRISQLIFNQNAVSIGQYAGIAVDIDRNAQSTTRDKFDLLSITQTAIGMRFGNTSTGNEESMDLSDLKFGYGGSAYDKMLFWIFVGPGAGTSQAENWRVTGVAGGYAGTDGGFAYTRWGGGALTKWILGTMPLNGYWDCPFGYNLSPLSYCTAAEKGVGIRDWYFEGAGRVFRDDMGTSSAAIPLTMENVWVNTSTAPDGYLIKLQRAARISNLNLTTSVTAPEKIIPSFTLNDKFDFISCQGAEKQPVFGAKTNPGPTVQLGANNYLCTQTPQVINLQSFAGGLTNGCAGTATLASGAATVSNACITGSRPVLCTENNTTTITSVNCSASSGSLSIKSASGTDTSTVSWAQS